MTRRLVLLRHGESQWNLENRFTGWTDVPLSDAGKGEALAAGSLMKREGLRFEAVHTSLLMRAIQTANLALESLEQLWLPVSRSWRLNERHYGALQGLNKAETAEKHGADQVHIWRRSYDVPPPALESSDPRHPANDPRYASLPADLLPATECLKDTLERMLPYWHDALVPQLMRGADLLVVAHGNSLRALVKHLDGLSDQAVLELNIPTGRPLLYELDEGLQPKASRYLE